MDNRTVALKSNMHIVYYTTSSDVSMSPWRNWLARSAVNRKVDGSIPSGDVF